MPYLYIPKLKFCKIHTSSLSEIHSAQYFVKQRMQTALILRKCMYSSMWLSFTLLLAYYLLTTPRSFIAPPTPPSGTSPNGSITHSTCSLAFHQSIAQRCCICEFCSHATQSQERKKTTIPLTISIHSMYLIGFRVGPAQPTVEQISIVYTHATDHMTMHIFLCHFAPASSFLYTNADQHIIRVRIQRCDTSHLRS